MREDYGGANLRRPEKSESNEPIDLHDEGAVHQVGEPGPQGVALLVEHQEELAAEAVVSKDGEVAGRVEYLISADSGTLTLSAVWRDGPGQLCVFVRD